MKVFLHREPPLIQGRFEYLVVSWIGEELDVLILNYRVGYLGQVLFLSLLFEL